MDKSIELKYTKTIIKYLVEEVDDFYDFNTMFDTVNFREIPYDTAIFLSQLYMIDKLKEDKVNKDRVGLDKEAELFIQSKETELERESTVRVGNSLIQLYRLIGYREEDIIDKENQRLISSARLINQESKDTITLKSLHGIFKTKLEYYLNDKEIISKTMLEDYMTKELVSDILDNKEDVNKTILKFFKTRISGNEYITNIKENINDLTKEEVIEFINVYYKLLEEELYLKGTKVGEIDYNLEGEDSPLTNKEISQHLKTDFKILLQESEGVIELILNKVYKTIAKEKYLKKEEEYTRLTNVLEDRVECITNGIRNLDRYNIFERKTRHSYFPIKRVSMGLTGIELDNFVFKQEVVDYLNTPIKLRNNYVTYLYKVVGVEDNELKVMETFTILNEKERYKLLVIEDKELEWADVVKWYERMLMIYIKEEKIKELKKHEVYLEDREKDYNKALEYYKEYNKIKEDSQLLLADSKISQRLSNQMESEKERLLQLEEEFNELKTQYLGNNS